MNSHRDKTYKKGNILKLNWTGGDYSIHVHTFQNKIRSAF